jgi:F0F1-type ATP synthase membrane subunit b/b'
VRPIYALTGKDAIHLLKGYRMSTNEKLLDIIALLRAGLDKNRDQPEREVRAEAIDLGEILAKQFKKRRADIEVRPVRFPV